MLLSLVIVSSIIMSVVWFLIITHLPLWWKHWFARHQFVFLLVHIPVMIFMSSIGGEGLIIAMGNLIGGAVGQLYLALWGMRQGLTLTGKRTNLYHGPDSLLRLKLYYKWLRFRLRVLGYDIDGLE